MLNRFTGNAERKAGLVAGVPAKRAGTPEEIAQTIVFSGTFRQGGLPHRPNHRSQRRQDGLVMQAPPAPQTIAVGENRHAGWDMNQEKIMKQTTAAKNKTLVLYVFDTLFNKRDYAAAERYWSPNYIQHSAHIEPGRAGLFNLIKSSPPTLSTSRD